MKIFSLKTKANLHFLPLFFLPSIPNENRVVKKQMPLVVCPLRLPKAREAAGGTIVLIKIGFLIELLLLPQIFLPSEPRRPRLSGLYRWSALLYW